MLDVGLMMRSETVLGAMVGGSLSGSSVTSEMGVSRILSSVCMVGITNVTCQPKKSLSLFHYGQIRIFDGDFKGINLRLNGGTRY